MPPVTVVPLRLCALCHRPLVAVGFARKNGKPHRDWNGRLYHKLCYASISRAPRPARGPRKPRKFRKWR